MRANQQLALGGKLCVCKMRIHKRLSTTRTLGARGPSHLMGPEIESEERLISSTRALLPEDEHAKQNQPGQTHCVPEPGGCIHSDLPRLHSLEES